MSENNFCTICKICGEEVRKTNHFWEIHSISLKSYYYTHHPKVCLETGKLIPFKSPEQYISQDFLSKNELKKWLKKHPEDAKDYCLAIIKDRFDKGKITYTPSQVELRSLFCPNIIWYESVCSYNLECEAIGLKPRFKYKVKDLSFENKKLDLIQDNREQLPLNLRNHSVEVKCLKYSDYSCSNSRWNNVYIERKSLPDLISSVSSGFDRLKREFDRCQKDNNYLIVLVEESINNAMAFNMLPHISKKIKASPDFVMKRIRDLIQEYSNLQFIFASGRPKASEILTKIYTINQDPTLLDWQFMVDSKLI